LRHKAVSGAVRDLPSRLLELLETLPEYQDRRDAAKTICGQLFKVSHRSLEVWPVPTRIVNGRASGKTADWLREAWRRTNSGPLVMGGRQRVTADRDD